jgi:hypothetical protein
MKIAQSTKFILASIFIAFFSSKAEANPKEIGQCLGFLAQLLQTEGAGNITQLNRNYIVNNKSALDIISKIRDEQRGCFKPGVDMEACLVSYTPYQKTLFYGYNSGRQGYIDVRVNDPNTKAIWQMKCASVN